MSEQMKQEFIYKIREIVKTAKKKYLCRERVQKKLEVYDGDACRR